MFFVTSQTRLDKSCAVRTADVFVALFKTKVQSDTKKRELLKNPTKIEEIQEKKLFTEIEPLQLAF